ncbi:MAG TPA: ABC transporter ATP-binding protein [Firmicutes bacterium]|nr:ABC transporter ATP-binding protein [Bacillota bacterium]
MSAILECINLSKNFNGLMAVSNLNLKLESGRIIGLLGPNGSGKTTLIKMISGLLTPASGSLLINGMEPGVETKKIVSYLPEQTYFNNAMKVSEILKLFSDFYEDFDRVKAEDMLRRLDVNPAFKFKTLSKGTKEKVQLVMVMARRAKLYLLDEPIGGVDPAAREYILDTVISNYAEGASVLISTHLISDVERVLNDFIFLRYGQLIMQGNVQQVCSEQGKSLDEIFREVFRC